MLVIMRPFAEAFFRQSPVRANSFDGVFRAARLICKNAFELKRRIDGRRLLHQMRQVEILLCVLDLRLSRGIHIEQASCSRSYWCRVRCMRGVPHSGVCPGSGLHELYVGLYELELHAHSDLNLSVKSRFTHACPVLPRSSLCEEHSA